MPKFLQELLVPKKLLVLFILLNLIIGIFIVRDYGTSTDEGWEFLFSTVAYGKYTDSLNSTPLQAYEQLDNNK